MKIQQLALCTAFFLALVYGIPASATDKKKLDKSLETPDLLLFGSEKIKKTGLDKKKITIEQSKLSVTKPDLLEVELKEKLKSVKGNKKVKHSEINLKNLKKNKQKKVKKFSDTLITEDPILEILD